MRWRAFFTKNNQTTVLDFRVADTPVAHAWASLYELNVIYPTIQGQNQSVCPSWPGFKNYHKSLLQTACETVNISGIGEILDQQTLNYLHKQFHYREESNQDTSVQESNAWHQINRSVHALESKLNYCVWRAGPSNQLPITDLMRRHFVITDESVPHLSLGYNTVGKNLLHAYVDNDIKLVIENGLRPQMFIGCEVVFNFSNRTSGLNEKAVKWANDNQLPVDLGDLAHQYLQQPTIATLITDIGVSDLAELVMTHQFNSVQLLVD